MGWQRAVVERLRAEVDQQSGAVALLVRDRGARHALGAVFPDAVALELPACLPEVTTAVRLPVADGDLGLGVVWLLGVRGAAGPRRLLWQEMCRAVGVGGHLVVVDHNRPRRILPRITNLVCCVVAGVHPVVRPAYPVAREIQAHGFDVLWLRFACAERVQIVGAHRGEECSRLDRVRGVL